MGGLTAVLGVLIALWHRMCLSVIGALAFATGCVRTLTVLLHGTFSLALRALALDINRTYAGPSHVDPFRMEPFPFRLEL